MPKIVALGDSHSIFYSKSKSNDKCISKFFEMWLGFNTTLPLTWYRFINEEMDLYNVGTIIANNSSNLNTRKIYIDNNIKNGDYVLFSYGWNDIQKNIKKYASDNYKEELNNLIENYIKKIETYKNKYKIIPIIQLIHPNPLKHKNTINGSSEERLNYILYANKFLKEICKKKHLLFFDIFDIVSDDKGFINKNYTNDGIHLNHNDENIHDIIDNKLIDLVKKTIKQDIIEESKNDSFGFIISTSIRNIEHKACLDETIKHIRRYHPTNKIILIDDGDDTYDIKSIYEKEKYIFVKKTEKKGVGEHLKYKILKDTNLFDKAIMIADKSMLQKKIPDIELEDFKFVMHFTNHRVHWDIILEPRTEYNIKNNIKTHTDLIRHIILRDYTHNKNFQKFALDKLINKHQWVGSNGALSIIDKKTLMYIEEKVNFIDIFSKVGTNRDRRACESIWALIAHFCYPDKDFTKSLEGLYYDGTHNFVFKGRGVDSGIMNSKWCVCKEYFNIIQFDRKDLKK